MTRSEIPPCSFLGDLTWAQAFDQCGSAYSSSQIWERRSSEAIKAKEEFLSIGARAPGDRGALLDDRTLRVLAAMGPGLAGADRERASVLDFGGGLGSHYFSIRPFLPFKNVSWHVVEIEPAIEHATNADLVSDELIFVNRIDLVPSPDIVLASGSLQYVEEPMDVLGALSKMAPRLILDRLPLSNKLEQHRLTIQTVPPEIYAASYPAWFFSSGAFEDELRALGLTALIRWVVREDVAHLDDERIEYCGSLLAL